jgi:two-component system, NtrC family, response regulator AtoC
MKVLVVDDEKNIRDSVVKYLALEKIEGKTAENGVAAKRILETESFDAAIIDLKMEGMNGLEVLSWLRSQGPELPVIMISAFGEVRDAVEAMKLGAKDYIVKPFDPEELIIRLKRVVEAHQNQERVKTGLLLDSGNEIWESDNPAVQRIAVLAEKVGPTSSTLLITGESGTGKEVLARKIHMLSDRRDQPFVPINIGGIPENLLESELFGYEKGAFTDATRRKTGLVELAARGTLFLDEIGDMPLHLQVKMLRFLQEKRIQRLGGGETIPLDVRIISATNKDLKDLISREKFREDLFFRLNVINIELPPLRERKGDIPRFAGFFIEKLNKTMGHKRKGITPEALDHLMAYDFPGNIRELENMIERAFILSDQDMLGVKDFPDFMAVSPTNSIKPGTVRELEKEAVRQALLKWEGNRTKASKELGFTRRTLLNKLKEYGL